MNDSPGMTFVLNELQRAFASIAALLNRNTQLEAENAALKAAIDKPVDPLQRADS